MPDLLMSREFLLSAIEAAGGPVRTADAERMLADSAWSCNRNTARKRLRTLTRASLLVARVGADNRTEYELVSGEASR